MNKVNKGIISFVVPLTLLLSTVFFYKAMVPVGTASAITIISVNPPTIAAALGQNFTININISDVVDLYGWEFKLGWNSTLLEALDVSEGTFLKQGGDTFFWPIINNTGGYVLVDCTLLGDVPGVSGNGTLATVKLYVEGEGECDLDLYDTKLVSSYEQPITHETIDGYYYTPIHDVAVIGLVASETTVHVTVENQGTETETFDVSVYYTRLGDPLIGTQTITLESGANSTPTFTWTPPSTGRYEIRAEASIVPDETDTADNTRTTIIYVGYGGSEASGSNSLILNLIIFAFSLLSVVLIVPHLPKKRSNLDISTTVFRHNMRTNARENIWHDLFRRKPL